MRKRRTGNSAEAVERGFEATIDASGEVTPTEPAPRPPWQPVGAEVPNSRRLGLQSTDQHHHRGCNHARHSDGEAEDYRLLPRKFEDPAGSKLFQPDREEEIRDYDSGCGGHGAILH